MSYKKFILLVVSVAWLIIFFNTKYYSAWIDKYILNPGTLLSDQMDRTSVEERKEYRFGNLYKLCQYMQKTLDTTTFKNGEPIVLLPPNEYLAAKGIDAFRMPEPAEFYYHIGVKTVWTTSPDVQKANWAIVASSKESLAFVPIRTAEQRRQLLDLYKNYKPAL